MNPFLPDNHDFKKYIKKFNETDDVDEFIEFMKNNPYSEDIRQNEQRNENMSIEELLQLPIQILDGLSILKSRLQDALSIKKGDYFDIDYIMDKIIKTSFDNLTEIEFKYLKYILNNDPSLEENPQ